MGVLEKRGWWIGLFLLFSLALVLRYLSLPFTNRDLFIHNLPWYETLLGLGIPHALGLKFSNYAPPYTYLLAVMTIFHNYLSPIVSIKLIPVAFDLLSSWFIYKIVRLKYTEGLAPVLASALFLVAPTIIINSAFWGQADSIYTFFLVVCLYYILIDRPVPAMLAFGLAFAFKAQAVFFMPFLAVMAFWKRVSWITFSLIPSVYILAILPVVLLGRPIGDALLIYVSQAGTYNQLSMKAPNLYSFMPESWYQPGAAIGTLIAVLALLFWLRHTTGSRPTSNPSWIVLIALTSVALTPFLLPKMHDRYFYPADVFSIILAFYWTGLWFIPIAYQTISLLAYTNFFYNATLPTIFIAGALNTLMVAWLVRKQLNLVQPVEVHYIVRKGMSWLAALSVPTVILGLCFRLLLTPQFIHFEYSLPILPTDTYGFTGNERTYWSSFALNYLLNKKEIKFLNKLRFENGEQVFDDRERLQMLYLKAFTGKLLNTWFLALLFLPVMGFFAWISNWLREYWSGLARGGWLSAGIGIALLIPTLLFFNAFFTIVNELLFEGDSWVFTSQDTITRLFPLRFWQDAFLFTALAALIGGLILSIGINRSINSPSPSTEKDKTK